nr:hypothetical protein [Tanacetum cinerariifolium]
SYGCSKLAQHEEELRVQRDRAEVAEEERSTLCARIRSWETVETILRNTVRDERSARARIEHYLGLVQKELRQSRMSTVRTERVSRNTRIS